MIHVPYPTHYLKVTSTQLALSTANMHGYYYYSTGYYSYTYCYRLLLQLLLTHMCVISLIALLYLLLQRGAQPIWPAPSRTTHTHNPTAQQYQHMCISRSASAPHYQQKASTMTGSSIESRTTATDMSDSQLPVPDHWNTDLMNRCTVLQLLHKAPSSTSFAMQNCMKHSLVGLSLGHPRAPQEDAVHPTCKQRYVALTHPCCHRELTIITTSTITFHKAIQNFGYSPAFTFAFLIYVCLWRSDITLKECGSYTT